MMGFCEAYIFDHLIKNRQSRAFFEVNLVGNPCLLNYWQAQLVIFFVDVHSQDLQQSRTNFFQP